MLTTSMLRIFEIGLCLFFASAMAALIVGRFMSVGTEADEREERLLRGRE